MIDLHCHILPGVDDGPTKLDESLALARFAVADGITHITATPHCHRHIRMMRSNVLPAVANLNAELIKAKIPLTVLPGAEIQAFDTAIYRHEFEKGVLCHLGDGRDFTLLEFNWDGRRYPADAVELVGWLRERQMQPIIAHPERHNFFRDDPMRVQRLVDAGAWLQVTVDSLLGNHGPEARVAGEKILRDYPNVILATDAHNKRRCSGLSAGYAWVREHLGSEREADLRGRADGVLRRLLGG